MKKIAILDYGVSNILSIKRAIEQFDIQVNVVDRPIEITSYDAWILPGVGAFKDGIAELEQRGMSYCIREYVNSGRPLLGICLGMQLLFDSSEEFGFSAGLGLIEGKVVKLPSVSIDQTAQRVPSIGWNPIINSEGSFFSKLHRDAEYYFCHSYSVKPNHLEHSIASYELGGHQIIAAVKKNNVYGFQFHPEKSGKAGLQLIHHFLKEINILE